jgi:hypothetical protein
MGRNAQANINILLAISPSELADIKLTTTRIPNEMPTMSAGIMMR